MSEEERLLKRLEYIEESYADNGHMDIGDFNDITKAIKLIKKKDKIINEMAKDIKEDTAKMDTFWCNGCLKIERCPFENEVEKCIKNWYERKSRGIIQEKNCKIFLY